MYKFFHPETGRQARATSYETEQAARERFADISPWDEIPAKNDEDLVAFLNSITGEILVIREVEE